jgi:two-component system phosphate regulon sensor histidine kinase PhoR
MPESLSRKAILIGIAVAAPPVLVIQIYTANAVIRQTSVIVGIVFVFVCWLAGRSLAGRINRLTEFVESLLKQGVPQPLSKISDDELGLLARSLSRVAPQIEELVDRLGIELMRREAILASMTDAVLAVDARMTVTFCNRAFLDLAGDHRAPEGMPLVRVIRDPVFHDTLTKVLESGETVRRRVQLSSADMRSYDVTAVPLARGSTKGAIAILHDVTPSERLERVKRDFIANVSHEIRTPLATIRGYAETLLEGGLEDRENRRKFVEIIQANSIRLNSIAADLLTLSELESGRPGAQPGPISLHDVLCSAVHAVEPAARLMGVQLTCDSIPEFQLLGYGIRLEQALVNLLDNAVKFNRPGGQVAVRADLRPDNLVEIRISDTGVGIPQEDLSRIFERFYRVDKARSRQVGGTGLGLSIVKHAVEQMDGTVAVQSELGKGSTFVVILPRQTT